MIKTIANIETVDYEVYGEPVIKGVVQPLKLGRTENVSIPGSFNFNGFWKMEHICSFCNQKTLFGNERIPNTYGAFFSELTMLSTRYYSVSFLQMLQKVFPESTRILFLKKHQYYILTTPKYQDENSEVLSIAWISVSYHQCIHCGTDFLCRYRFDAGAAVERGTMDGRLSRVFIDEIVNIKIESGKSFLQLVKEEQTLIS